MGRISRFNLNRAISRFNTEYFFETGTWRGDGLAYAARHPFKHLYSSEIITTVAEKAKDRFRNSKNITIINKSSTEALKGTIPLLDGNCLFWLDAHFPGAEEGLSEYNATEDENIKLPLQQELEIIAGRQDKYHDVILIDDLRIYESANYESGNLPKEILPPTDRSLTFVDTLFGKTHEIYRSLKDEGYLFILPRKTTKENLIAAFAYELTNKIRNKII